jgi:hypothetical protein
MLPFILSGFYFTTLANKLPCTNVNSTDPLVSITCKIAMHNTNVTFFTCLVPKANEAMEIFEGVENSF